MPHFMIVLILYINLLNLSWIKISIFEGYGAFKECFSESASKGETIKVKRIDELQRLRIAECSQTRLNLYVYL